MTKPDRWRIAWTEIPGERSTFVDWDEEIAAPVSRTETRQCLQCGTGCIAHVAVDNIREFGDGVALYAGNLTPWAHERMRWVETITYEPHHCQPASHTTEVMAGQWTPLGRGMISHP